MFHMFDNLSAQKKGFLLVLLGVALLLFTFGFLHRLLNTVIIFSGFFLVGVGLYKLGVHKKVQHLINRKK